MMSNDWHKAYTEKTPSLVAQWSEYVVRGKREEENGTEWGMQRKQRERTMCRGGGSPGAGLERRSRKLGK